MLVNDANGEHLVAPGVLYVIQKYVYKKNIRSGMDRRSFSFALLYLPFRILLRSSDS